ncbi:MAG: hypothetical protein PSX42_02700 [bacterium]|nr:hypothetical protein [bacterium]
MKKSTKFLIFVYFFISLNFYAYDVSNKVDYEIEVAKSNLENGT